MIDSHSTAREGSRDASAAAVGAANPYTVALAALGVFAWVLAFMLWIVLAQVTDYTVYDQGTAAALTAWCYLLIGAGFAAVVGAAVIARVRRELRSRS